MRAAAIVLILAISTTIVAGAQCAVACVHPASPPPCHHSPEKAAKVCDSSSDFGEKRSVTVIEAPPAVPVTRAWSAAPPARGSIVATAGGPLLHPPREAAPQILRI